MEKRRNYFIDKEFQTKFILKFCVIVLFNSILIGIFLFILSRNSTTVAIENTKVITKTTADFILPLILISVIVGSIFSAISAVILALFISHKIAGPLFRVKKELKKLEEGDFAANFNVRKNDQLKELSNSLTSMLSSLREKLIFIKNKVVEIKKEKTENLKEKIDKLEEELNKFKGL